MQYGHRIKVDFLYERCGILAVAEKGSVKAFYKQHTLTLYRQNKLAAAAWTT